jgi:hypothetical protein
MQETLRQIEERFPRVAQLETWAREEQQRLVKEVAAAVTEFPVLWRIDATPYHDDSVQLGKIILTELRTTWQSNRTLCEDLADDAELIWKVPPLVRGVLTDAGVNLYSITWTTSEERIAEETGLRTSAFPLQERGVAIGHRCPWGSL